MKNTATVTVPNLSAEMLRQAATLTEEIATKQAALHALLNGQPLTPAKGKRIAKPAATTATGKRVVSPEARARMAEAAKARWAKANATAAASPVPVLPATAA
jgi:hypothetical protein